MNITVRTAKEEERKAAIEATEAAFGWDVPEPDMEGLLALIEPGRQTVALDAETIVGAGGNYTFDLSVPGGSVAAAGLTVVGVVPTHRRKGILRRLMRALLDDPAERGEPVSILWASESGIYGRFGYGLASQHMQVEAERSRMAFLDDPGPSGYVRRLDQETAAKVFPDIYDRVSRVTPGMPARSAKWWEKHRLRDSERHRGGGGPAWYVALELDGAPEAYAMYRVHSEWPDGNPSGKLEVIETMATSTLATREMWRFLFGVDLIDTVKADFLPIDLPLTHMLTEPRRMRRRIGDNLWLRVIDVPGALQARAYAAADRLRIGLRDDLFPDNEGVWELDTTGDEAAVQRSDGQPDVAMGITELGAIYLGGTKPSELALAARVEGDPGAIDRLDVMFRSARAPWCPEIF